MQPDTRPAAAADLYAAAYASHYSSKDLSKALGQYSALVRACPDTPEADYSRSQIANIAKAVVPTQELFQAQLALALEYAAAAGPTGRERHSVAL